MQMGWLYGDPCAVHIAQLGLLCMLLFRICAAGSASTVASLGVLQSDSVQATHRDFCHSAGTDLELNIPETLLNVPVLLCYCTLSMIMTS